MSNTPLKVLFFVGSMSCGGSERQIVEILKRLDRRRFRPYLYLHHRQGDLLDEIPADVPICSFWEQFSGTLNAKWHHLLGTTDRARWQHLAKYLKRERIDLLYNRTYLATLDAAAASRAARVPRISVVVGDPLEEIHLYSEGQLAEEKKVAHDAFESADRVIAVSRGIQQRLIDDLAVSPERCIMIPNAIDTDQADRLAHASSFPFDKARCNLLSVARLSAEKGHAWFLQCLHELVYHHNRKELLWHIVGTGPLEAMLRSEVDKLELSDNVQFVGFQKNPYPLYRGADLFCLPSIHEAFGCVMIEALALGLPVLATDCPSGPTDILNGGHFGKLVPVGDQPAMVQAILDFLDHRGDWLAQAELGRKNVLETYGLQTYMPRLENLFERTVRASASGRPPVRS